MSDSEKTQQNQTAGLGSTNVQIGQVLIGLSYDDVRQIASDVFVANFEKLSSDAKFLAEERAAIFREDTLKALAESSTTRLEAFKEPDKQLALFDAQKAYAITGDDDLKTTLIGILVDISKEKSRTLKSIVLHEALKVAPTLTAKQIQILSASFAVRYSKNPHVKDLSEFEEMFSKYALFEMFDLEASSGDFRHIEYSRCGNVSVGTLSFYSVLQRGYPGLFSQGFTGEQLLALFGDRGVPMDFAIPCLHNAKKLQVGFLNIEAVASAAKKNRWTEAQEKVAKDQLLANMMNEPEVAELLKAGAPRTAALMHAWNSSQLKNLTLTSVGISIAHSFLTKDGGSFAKLDDWM